MNNKQQIEQVLTKIKTSQSNFKVQTSRYLKELDIFKFNNLTQDDIKLFYIGNQQLPFGLLYCCGNKSKIDGSLRKSAFYSTELLLSLFEKHQQSKLFIKVFADLDDEDYKQMCLSVHVMSDKELKNKGLVAYKILYHLLNQRPHVDLDNLLESRLLQEKFRAWFKKQPNLQQEQKLNTYQEQDLKVENLNLQREKTKKERTLQQISLQFDGNTDYLIKTFYNPFQLQKRVTKSKKNREAAIKQKQVIQSLNATIDEDLIDYLKENVKNLDQIISKIHLDSKQFEPQTFLRIIQPQLNKQKLNEFTQQNEEMVKNVIYFFIDDFFHFNQAIIKMHNEFLNKEIRNIDRKNKVDSTKQTIEDSILFGTIQKSTFALLTSLNINALTMNEMKSNSQNLRLVLELIRRSYQYLQYPSLLKEAFQQRDNDKIMMLITQNSHVKSQNISIFQSVNDQVNLLHKDIIEDLILQLQNNLSDYSQLQIVCQSLLMLIEQLPELKIDGQQLIMNKLQKALFKTFNSYFNQQEQFVQNYEIENVSGDFVIEFLQQCALPKSELMNTKIIENFIVNEFSEQFNNYKSLINYQKFENEPTQLRDQVLSVVVDYLKQIQLKLNRNQYDSLKQIIVKINQLFGTISIIEQQINQIEITTLASEFKMKTLQKIQPQFSIPIKDFFGINFSDSVNEILESIIDICRGRIVTGGFVVQLLEQGLQHISTFIKQSQDYIVFLHNIKLLSQQIKDIINNIYSVTRNTINIKEFTQQILQHNILQQFYQPTIQEYVKQLKFEFPFQMDIIPRPYIFDWLQIMNEQAILFAQVLIDSNLMDCVVCQIITQFFKLIEKACVSKDKLKQLQQLHYEIGLMEVMTKLWQGQSSQEGFSRLYKKIQEYQQSEINDIEEWVKKEKYKISYNFKALCGYY